MALTFTCDYCKNKYPAQLGGRVGNYQYGNERIMLMDDKAPCKACEDEAEQAKSAALEARKRKNDDTH